MKPVFNFTFLEAYVWFRMKKFIAKRWKFINKAKNRGATYPEIYETLASKGFPGTFTTFYTYCLEVSKMTKTQRKRCAKS